MNKHLIKLEIKKLEIRNKNLSSCFLQIIHWLFTSYTYKKLFNKKYCIQKKHLYTKYQSLITIINLYTNIYNYNNT